MIYSVLGKYEQALREAQRLTAMDPDFAIGYLEVAFNNTFLGAFRKFHRGAAARDGS